MAQQFTIYRSTDTSAPTLSGTAGDLVNLLDKCLVSGYGSKAAAGWTKPYTNTNAAVFKQGAVSVPSLGHYLQVDDSAVSSAREAHVSMFETMSAYNTGTNQRPAATPFAVWRKSSAVSATTRVWMVAADDRTVYLFVQTGDVANNYQFFAFGDFYSYRNVTDSYRTMLIGNEIDQATSPSSTNRGIELYTGGNMQSGHFLMRRYNGIFPPTDVNFSKTAMSFNGTQTAALGASTSSAGITYPNPADSKLYLTPCAILEGQTNSTPFFLRGRMRGLYGSSQVVSAFTDGDTFSGEGTDYSSGRTFLIVKSVEYGNGNSGYAIIETSATLDTSS